MALSNFITKNNDSLAINLNSMPDKGFIRANRVKNVVSFRLLADNEKRERGCPDVEIISVFGEKAVITRNELVKNYKFPTGKKIRISGLKKNTKYRALCADNREVYYTMVPENAVGYLNSKPVPKGVVIVALGDGNGGINRNNISVMSLASFKKMCITPKTPEIVRNASRRNKSLTVFDRKVADYKRNKASGRKAQKLPNRNADNGVSMQEPRVMGNYKEMPNMNLNNRQMMQSKGQMGPMNSQGGRVARPVSTPNGLMNQQVQAQQRSVVPNQQGQQTKGYEFKAVCRLIDSSTNKLVGFIIINRQNKQRKIHIGEAVELCRQRKIINLMLSKKTNVDGSVTEYLRGNGISLEQLPASRI